MSRLLVGGRRVSVRAYLSLGSNVGDRRGQLRQAVRSIAGVVAVSSVYETEPIGGPPQDDYLNLVVGIDTDLTPRQLLDLCHRLEATAGRVRTERFGPRSLDVDILWVDSGSIDQPDLQVPHPRMTERRFVMEPLHEVAPELAPQGWQDEAEGDVTLLGPL
jgi:2-amino-4-hydroxy-6-hydroxymethyldihydropteridine diphosphokinase